MKRSEKVGYLHKISLSADSIEFTYKWVEKNSKGLFLVDLFSDKNI